MLVRSAPCALLWPAAMIVWGPGYVASKHRHHCVQLVLALDDTLRLRGGPGRKWIACGAALVRPDVFHEVDSANTRVLLAFVDVESALGAALSETIESNISVVAEKTVAEWRRALGNSQSLSGDRVEPFV